MKIDVITIFPEVIRSILNESILGRAAENRLVEYNIIPLRRFTSDVHHTVDDRPYGGGPGMIMKPEPLFEAVESVQQNESRVILMCPQGLPFTQQNAGALSKEGHLIFICPHYEGVDERVRTALVTDEISIGDYILTSGTLAAAVVIDAVVRLLPGALGGGESAVENESFQTGMLEHPHYTRPAEYRGMKVPEILRSGNHEAIARWKQAESCRRTTERRPDLLK